MTFSFETKKVWIDAKVDSQAQILTLLKHLRCKLGKRTFTAFKEMNQVRTNPDMEQEIKRQIEWVHAQTARGPYKKGEDESDAADEEEDGEKKSKSDQSKAGKKRKFNSQTSTNNSHHDEQQQQTTLTPESDWYHYYNEMQSFYGKYGHFDVSPANNLLYQWMNNQRQAFKEKTLNSNRIYLLNHIKFPWDTRTSDHQPVVELTPESDWYSFYNELRRFYMSNGHCQVSDNQNELLYEWLQNQQKALRENKLTNNRKYLLDQVQFRYFKGNP